MFLLGIFASVSLLQAETFDLNACIARAMGVHPGVQAAAVDIDIARAQLDQANAARVLPKFELMSVVGPSPEARGNALVGDTNLSSLSVFTQTEATFVQPLLTFGLLSGAKNAATAGVIAQEAGLQRSRGDLELQVAEVYFGMQLAEDLWALATEAQGDFKKARDYVAEKLDEDEGDFTYADLGRIDRFAYDVTEKVNAARKIRALAGSAMRLLLGLNEADSLALADQLTPVDTEIGSLASYLGRVNDRPEMQQLQAALQVRESLSQVAKSEQYPQIFIAGQFKYGYAPNRDDQKSPFAQDRFNILQAGAVVGFRQSLSFGLTSAKAKKARLEHQKLMYQAQLAEKGVAIEIEKIYRELIEARDNMAAAEKARRATRRWFVSVRDGFNAGLEKASDMIDVAKEYGVIRAKYYEAVFDFNRSWAKLQRATGQSITQ
ncbi:MAG: TolC family protein [Candidatus Latescibacteria bacterium]|nr:TolC family protein [Candidatus Latescibacterota bacterium]